MSTPHAELAYANHVSGITPARARRTPAPLTGQAIGDALGAAFEFRSPHDPGLVAWTGEFVGGGWGLKAGQYTDDTKMALCIARSLVARQRFDARDIARRYVQWLDSGDLRGIGCTCSRSIQSYKSAPDINTCGATGEYAAGNGTAMRAGLLGLTSSDFAVIANRAIADANLTHANDDARAGSVAVAHAVRLLAQGWMPVVVLDMVIDLNPFPRSKVVAGLRKVRKLLDRKTDPLREIQTIGTSGWVVHTVPAAFYALCATGSFREAVVTAVRGGHDADTTGAVAGALAGAYYGLEGIPAEYLNSLEDRADLAALEYKLPVT